MILKNSDHCNLCDNAHFDFSKGVFCGLDMRRPEFKNTCIKIDLNNTYKEKIEAINIEYESVLKSKPDFFGHMILYSIISVIIFVITYFLTQHLYDKGYISTLTITLIVIGCLPLGKVVGLFNSYRTKFSIAENKKNKLDKLTELYGYSYDIAIDHMKDSLGNVDHHVDLKIEKGKLKK